MAGVGATTFGGVDYAVNRNTPSATRFEHLGRRCEWARRRVGGKFVRGRRHHQVRRRRLLVRPVWGCYVTSDAQYANHARRRHRPSSEARRS
jgi:hypothetical protein